MPISLLILIQGDIFKTDFPFERSLMSVNLTDKTELEFGFGSLFPGLLGWLALPPLPSD